MAMSADNKRHSIMRLLGALCLCLPVVVSANSETLLDPLDPLVRPATMLSKPESAVMVGIASTESRLVAVGERGLILVSDDAGKSWKQSFVPVSVTLTAVTFPSPRTGYAVGHSGMVLKSIDGGRHWSRVLDGRRLAELPVDESDGAGAADDVIMMARAGDPLLDVAFVDEETGFVAGAFGLLLRTDDGGQTWRHWHLHLPNPDGNHLYAMRRIGSELYIAGERGAFYVSHDAGLHFDAATTPYQGSFFGLNGAAGDNSILVYGLEGKAFTTRDQGHSWHAVDTRIGSSLAGSAVLPDKRKVLVSVDGDVLIQQVPHGTFARLDNQFPPLSAATLSSSGELVGVGPRGVVRLTKTAQRGEQQH